MLLPSFGAPLHHLLENNWFWYYFAFWLFVLSWWCSYMSLQRVARLAMMAVTAHGGLFVGAVLIDYAALTTKTDGITIALGLALLLITLIALPLLCSSLSFPTMRLSTPAGPSLGQDDAAAVRSRIAADLHDGVASRLVALLASLELNDTRDKRLAHAVQDCLLELQVTVDGLHTQDSESLNDMLAHVRYRFQPAFERYGVRLAWEVSDITESFPMRSDTAAEMCKIAQEALSNALRHAGATCIEVRLHAAAGDGPLVMEIQDNGRGLPSRDGQPCPRRGGNGLGGMKVRADALDAHIVIGNAAPHGTRVRVTLPRASA